MERLSEEEFDAIDVTIQVLDKMIKRDGPQDPSYPYMVASKSDLYRIYGREILRDDEHIDSEQGGAEDPGDDPKV
jgi:hypothetical protein